MITEYHFPTPVYIQEIPNAVELNQYLEQKILQWSQQNKGVSKTNAGGWHSTTDMNQKEEYNVLTKELFNMQEEIFKKEFLTQKPVLGNMWANINYPGNFNRPHLHPNALFSCPIEKKYNFHPSYGEKYIINLVLELPLCFLRGYGMKLNSTKVMIHEYQYLLIFYNDDRNHLYRTAL